MKRLNCDSGDATLSMANFNRNIEIKEVEERIDMLNKELKRLSKHLSDFQDELKGEL